MSLVSKRIIDKTEVVAANGVIAAMHPLAAQAGMEILKQGGNAADAAVAAAFAVGVVEPFMSGLGGLAYIVVHHAPSGRTIAIDGSNQVPRAASEDMFELVEPPAVGSGVYGWRATQDEAAESGYRSVLVPGAVAAYTRLLELYGSMPLREVMAPAIRLAKEGFTLDWYVFANCASELSRLRAFPETMEVFYRPDGTPFRPVNHDDNRTPDRLVQADLARTLEAIAEGGADAFYRGAISHAITNHLSSHGGILTEADLADYRVMVREPLDVNYRGRRIAMVPENTGGPTVAQMLNILEDFDLASTGYNTATTLHLIAEASRMAFADRFAYLGDTAFAQIPLTGLQSKAYADARRGAIDPAHGPAPEPRGNPWPFDSPRGGTSPPPRESIGPADGHTTHLSVIDRDHSAVALTASLGRLFGSGVVIPGTGVLLNNGMMWFDPQPGSINSIQPGKRTMSASTPTLVLDDQGVLMALGAPGGRKVLTAVLQTMLNVLDFGLGMQAAVSAPRIHCETGPIHADARLPTGVVEELRRIGHEVVLREETFLSSYFGRPNGILVDRKAGVLRGGVEPYKMSTALGF
jgi:gamma-glutamyltranspeptidase/glutathione hydrolase